MSVTLKDVAKLANVSISTASLALNGKHVAPETRKRILDAAEKLDFVMGSAAKSLKSGKSHSIGFYILGLDEAQDLSEEGSDFWYILLKGIMEVTSNNGYTFIFERSLWDDGGAEENILSKVKSKSIDGAIIIPQYNFHYSFLEPLEKLKFPYVLINPNIEIDNIKKIFIDEYNGMKKATEYLISKGFNRIAFINGPKNHVDAINRINGFIDTLIDSRIPVYNEFIINSDFTISGGKQTVSRILKNTRNIPDAILCSNDYLAVGAIHAINDLGFRVPEDISVFGYGDHDVSRCVIPELTTMHTPILEIGRNAANKLFSQINGIENDSFQTCFDSYIVERNSVK